MQCHLPWLINRPGKICLKMFVYIWAVLLKLKLSRTSTSPTPALINAIPTTHFLPLLTVQKLKSEDTFSPAS